MSENSQQSDLYNQQKERAKRTLATAEKVHIHDVTDDDYKRLMHSGHRGFPCRMFTDDGSVDLLLPSRLSAFEPGLLDPRFARKGSRVLDRLPKTLHAVEAEGQAGTDNSALTVVQPTPARPEPRKPLYHFSQSPVVLVDPIDKIPSCRSPANTFPPPLDSSSEFRLTRKTLQAMMSTESNALLGGLTSSPTYGTPTSHEVCQESWRAPRSS